MGPGRANPSSAPRASSLDAQGPQAPPPTPVLRVIGACINAFPLFVVGAAVLGAAKPAAFDWFQSRYTTAALAVTMLGMGLTLTLQARQDRLAGKCVCVRGGRGV